MSHKHVTQEQEDVVSARIRELVADQAMKEPKDVTDGASLADDLGFDELDKIELVIDLEKEFNIEIDDEKADACKLVADIRKLVLSLL